jgi:hypothetical protein
VKAYTLGVNGFVSRRVLEALGEPPHRRQATAVIIAKTKAAACALAESVGIRANPRDPETRVADGWPIADKIRAYAGNEPGVFVLPLDRTSDSPIVEVHSRDDIREVGRGRSGRLIEWGER